MHEKSFSSADKQARIMVILASGISDTNGLTKLIRYKAYVKNGKHGFVWPKFGSNIFSC